MPNPPITTAIITAAGKGERMRPLTNDRCKPMVEVAGQPIIGHVLNRLQEAGVTHVSINTHYKPESLRDYLQQYQDTHTGLTIKILHEDVLLDTGGGIKNLLQTLPDPESPFYVVSGDSYWEDSGFSVLNHMAENFDPEAKDIQLLLKDLKDMHPTVGTADYDIDKSGNISRSQNQTGLYAWTSVRIIKNKSVFDNTPEQPFTFRILMDRAEQNGRLQGIRHSGQWHHFSTPADVAAVNNLSTPETTAIRGAPAVGR